MNFGRLITAMVTPFDDRLQVDYNKAEYLIDYLIEEQQNDSIVVCGTTGEAPTLTDEEKLNLFELAVKRANGRCKIIAGTGDNNTAHSIELTKKAEAIGVDGILLVTPYYNRPSQEGLYQHFATIAENTALPVMLYNVPKRTGINLEADTVIRLSKIKNITSLKEANSDFAQITKIVSQTRDDFLVYSGDDDITLPMLSVGGYGVVSVAGHLFGKEIKQMIDAFFNGDVQKASEWHGKLNPIFKGLFISPNPVMIKCALNLRGIDVGGVRLPLVKANEDEERFIKDLLG